MDSITKVKVPASGIEEIVRAAFGNHQRVLKVRELCDGWYNSIYEVVLGDGKPVVIKIAPPGSVRVLRYEKNLATTEMSLLEYFRENTEVPVPEVLYKDTSSKIVESPYFIMTKLEGKAYDKLKNEMSVENRARIERGIGAINRRINEVRGPGFGLYGAESKTETWAEAFLGLVRDLLDDSRDFGARLPLEQEQIFALFQNQEDALNEVKEPCLVHWDLHDGNVIVDPLGNVSGILDCDRAMWGDPLIEVYFSFLFQDSGNFREGYGADLFTEPGARIRRTLYDSYLSLVMAIECYSRKVSDSGHLTWTASQLETQLGRLRGVNVDLA